MAARPGRVAMLSSRPAWRSYSLSTGSCSEACVYFVWSCHWHGECAHRGGLGVVGDCYCVVMEEMVTLGWFHTWYLIRSCLRQHHRITLHVEAHRLRSRRFLDDLLGDCVVHGRVDGRVDGIYHYVPGAIRSHSSIPAPSLAEWIATPEVTCGSNMGVEPCPSRRHVPR